MKEHGIDLSSTVSKMTKWDKAHMDVAFRYAELSTAVRKKVGAVIVRDNRIISIGYNGMPSGASNVCEDEVYYDASLKLSPDEIKKQYPYKDSTGQYGLKTKPEVLHAEANAILKVASSTESTRGTELYVTCQPCLDCAKLIYQAGIVRVLWAEKYPRGEGGVEFLKELGVECEQISTDT